MRTLVLNTPTCKIFQTAEGFVLQMKMESGEWVQQKPFFSGLSGLIGALNLSVDVIAGKVWLEKIVAENEIFGNKRLK